VLLALGAFPGQELEKELLSFLAETESPEEKIACAEALAELQCYEAILWKEPVFSAAEKSIRNAAEKPSKQQAHLFMAAHRHLHGRFSLLPLLTRDSYMC